jgi:hypothetical protein
LGPCDRAIILARRQFLRAIKDVQEGRPAPNVMRTPEANHYPHLMVVSEVVDAGGDWRKHWQDKLAALR